MAGCAPGPAILPHCGIHRNRMTGITLRRLRQDAHIRALTRGARPHPEQFIQPLFVVEGIAAREAIPGLTGRLSRHAGVAAGADRGGPRGRVQQVPAVRRARPHMRRTTSTGPSPPARSPPSRSASASSVWLAVDVCLCSSTPHGHCGVLNDAHDHLDNARQRQGTGGRRAGLCARRRRLRRAQRHDGRPHRRDPPGAGCRRAWSARC